MIPGQVNDLLKQLEDSGFEAFLVGGCVRDLCLGRPVHDWDVTTSAHPEDVMAIFPHTVPTGLRHGTVTVMVEKLPIEVTTYRSDGRYENGRSPEAVSFVGTLQEDLCRRDFTINAMAMGADGRIFDDYGGREDLQARQIRCVGEPAVRFSEDALRILRAIRFSAQLGFSLEEGTRRAMGQCAGLCGLLSSERIREEMEKILCSDQPEKIGEFFPLGILDRFGLQSWQDLTPLARTEPDRVVRWAGLLVYTCGLDLQALHMDKKTLRIAQAAAEAYAPAMSLLDWKTLIARQGWEVARCLSGLNGQGHTLKEIRDSGDCVSLSQLAVTGDMLGAVPGKQIGYLLDKLLFHVLKHPEDNRRDRLLSLAREQGLKACGNQTMTVKPK